MFFLGISAHLFIYLLVPAFLTICLLNSGTADYPEVGRLLPNVISYEVAVRDCPEETYVYGVAERMVEYGEEPSLSFVVCRKTPLPAETVVYSSPCVMDISLRAPPVVSLFCSFL